MRVLFYFDRVMHYHVSLFQELERRLIAEGGEVVLVSGQRKTIDHGRVSLSQFIVSGQRTIRFYERTVGPFTIRCQWELPREIRSARPDLVVVAGHPGSVTYWQLGLLRRMLGFRYVTWQCGFDYNPGRFKTLVARQFLRLFDHHLAYHTSARDYLLQRGVQGSRITVVHNTIDERRITPMERDAARSVVQGELDLPRDLPIVLFVGAILEEKRLDLLVEAIRRQDSRRISLVIVGDGPFLTRLRSLSQDLPYVRFTGNVIEGVGRFFDAADVFVLPGTGGLAINEAMAHGLPVIAGYGDGSTVDLVIPGLNGYRLEHVDSDELALHLGTILQSPERSCQMGQESRRLATTVFSFCAFVDRILHGLRTVHAGTDAGEPRPGNSDDKKG